MQQSVLLLGRQPSLGIAELESLYGSNALTPIAHYAVHVDAPTNKIDFSRLGGSIKLAKVLTVLPYTDWQKLVDYVSVEIPKHLGYLPEGKLKLGLSAFGLNVPANHINRSSLALKKIIKNTGRSVRVVPNNTPSLNSAQVLHNQLTSELGMELVFIKNGSKTILAQTVAEQDINAYAARDQERPKRDARVGMLPPKLAQIIINLAGTSPENTCILDPFCGTGVVLQEAQLMGFSSYGTDLDERMIEYSKSNIEWLEHAFKPSGKNIAIEQGDATNAQWTHPFTAVAAETYLGQPFSAPPAPDRLNKVMQDVHMIHKKFLSNLASQTPPGFRLCIAVPAWKTNHGFKHLKTLDYLEELGYTRMKFVHCAETDLIYHREGQYVARELVVLKRK